MPPHKKTSRVKRNRLVPSYCEICAHQRKITKHRIKPGREKGEYEPYNTIGLCLNCHDEAEMGLVTRDILFAIVKRRIESGRTRFVLDELVSLAQQMVIKRWMERQNG